MSERAFQNLMMCLNLNPTLIFIGALIRPRTIGSSYSWYGQIGNYTCIYLSIIMNNVIDDTICKFSFSNHKIVEFEHGIQLWQLKESPRGTGVVEHHSLIERFIFSFLRYWTRPLT